MLFRKLVDAVEREVNEEIGLNINSLSYIFHIDDLTDKCGHGGELHDWHVFNSYEIIDESSLKLGAEVKSIKWVSLNELQKMKNERLKFYFKLVILNGNNTDKKDCIRIKFIFWAP